MFRRLLALFALAVLLAPVASCKKKKKELTEEQKEAKKQHFDRVAVAKQLLAEAGYPEGKGFPKVEFLYNTSEAHQKIAAVVQDMWKKNLGIEIDLVNKEWKAYLDETSKLNYQIARRGWIGDYADPFTFLELMTSKSGNNNTGWGTAEYDKLIHDSAAERNPEKRMDLLMKAEKILLDDMPVIPIYFYVSQNMWRNEEVKGLHNNILNIHPIREVVKGDGAGTLVLNNHTEIASLDPGISRGVSEHRVQICVFEGLMIYNPQTLKAEYGVAEKYEMSEDGKTYTFTLRDCRWSDGAPVTAHDFEYAWKRVLDPKTASDYAHMMYVLRGGEEYNTGKGSADQVGVKAKSDKVLVVELTNPLPYFLDLMPFFTFFPVRKDVIEKHGQEWTKPGNFVGNGPFKLKAWVTNEHIILEKNESYWASNLVKQREVKWLPTENAATAFNLYDKKLCDYLDQVPLEIIDQLKGRPDFHSATYLGVYYFSFNVTKPPFNDKRVRKALALALEREIITDKIVKGGQQPAYHFVPTGFENRGYKSERFDQ